MKYNYAKRCNAMPHTDFVAHTTQNLSSTTTLCTNSIVCVMMLWMSFTVFLWIFVHSVFFFVCVCVLTFWKFNDMQIMLGSIYSLVCVCGTVCWQPHWATSGKANTNGSWYCILCSALLYAHTPCTMQMLNQAHSQMIRASWNPTDSRRNSSFSLYGWVHAM